MGYQAPHPRKSMRHSRSSIGVMSERLRVVSPEVPPMRLYNSRTWKSKEHPVSLPQLFKRTGRRATHTIRDALRKDAMYVQSIFNCQNSS